ncbi:MAG: hypothetical protein HRU19_05325 [Pseudobacteriovorax sp.]|nr:hypothetical protein [Pseudobacteriovorax sp.]
MYHFLKVFTCIAVVMSFGCSNTGFNKKDKSNQKESTPEQSELKDSDKTVAEPQMVGGAFLVCNPESVTSTGVSPDDLSAEEAILACEVRDNEDNVVSEGFQLSSVGVMTDSGEVFEPRSLAYTIKSWAMVLAIQSDLIDRVVSVKADIQFGDQPPTAISTQEALLGCPENYTPVLAGDPTTNAPPFCVATYEMKQGADDKPVSQAAGRPWVAITKSDAMDRCADLGDGYSLMTNDQWMAIARTIELNPENWSSGRVNEGSINRGHSDNSPAQSLQASVNRREACFETEQTCSHVAWDSQKRTHVLTFNHIIWDFAGNVHEHVDWQVDTSDKASPQNAWTELNSTLPTQSMPAISYLPTNLDLNRSHGIGGYFPGRNDQGGTVQRGGSYGDNANTGIYALALDLAIDAMHTVTGFRCVWTPTSDDDG